MTAETDTAAGEDNLSDGHDSAEAPVLPLGDAVARIPPSLAEVFHERLRGEFREVRVYRPKSRLGLTISSEPNPALDEIPLDDGEMIED